MKLPHFLRQRTAAIIHDLCMVPVAWLGAFWLRFNLETIPERFWEQAVHLLPLVMIIQGSASWYFGLYRGVWRFASLPDLKLILKAVLAGASSAAMAFFLYTRMVDIPRSVLILYPVLLFGFLGGPRLIYRWMKDKRFSYRAGKRVLIVGCGEAAELMVRELLRGAEPGFVPVAFVDDKPSKQGREIHGIRVVGVVADIPRVCKDWEIDLILIAIPSARAEHMQRVVEVCEQAQIPFRTLPPLKDLVSGRVTVKALREVSIEDLLGREPVTLDWDRIKAGIAGKRVLVTGGGGSIGSELCRQIAGLQPAELVILDRSEFNLYQIDQTLRKIFPGLSFQCRMADVCDRPAVRNIMRGFRPDIVFHAAAYKHVPMLEEQIREACRNNILGTRNMAHAAMESRCEAFVLISTDKAVNPTSVMGASKRVAEILCQSLDKISNTRFITVRFGNVLGSTGSVVPLFRRQIEMGGPVTVTHPGIQRFFMTTAEAAQLIMQACMMGQGGEIFVLKMGEPVRIGYLAEQMILLSGKRPGKDIEITYSGLRPGEKLFEELFHPDERVIETEHEKILLAHPRQTDGELLEISLKHMEEASEIYNEQELFRILMTLVPEFDSQLNVQETIKVPPLLQATN